MYVYIGFVNIELICLLKTLIKILYMYRKCEFQTNIILELNTSPTNTNYKKKLIWVYWTMDRVPLMLVQIICVGYQQTD
jgi:hypothetical protein